MPTVYAIAAGKLPHRVTVQQLTQTTKESTGDQTETWIPRESVWAAIEPIAGNERFASAQIQGDVTHMITIRPIDDLKSSWRITHEGRTFHIAQPPINIEERGRKMVLMCKEMTD